MTERSASIRARLMNRAREQGDDFNLILTRYALERFLYRLSLANPQNALWLKGALLFDLWFDVPHRPTRDADFLGFGPNDAETLRTTVREICGVAVDDDGMFYDTDSVNIGEIRENNGYGGLRVRLVGYLGTARISVQLDVGFGDAVTPGPEEVDYPTLLNDLPAPKLRVYPRATVIAEKLEALVTLGMANSRLKDYFDLYALARESAVDNQVLADAIDATFRRRNTPLPEDIPLGLSDEFSRDELKRTQWKAFLDRNRLDGPTLEEVVGVIRDFLTEPLRLARQNTLSS